MKLPRRTFLYLTAGTTALSAVSRIAWAQVYPTRPITIVVPFPAGGPTDTLARILSEHMRISLGQPVIIENVSGAGGSIGVGRVARAAPALKNLGFSHVSARPKAYKQNAEAMDAFKKTSPSVWRKSA
jgi:tripartite-type tricarboxylate transporter receptor subunit TctC